MTYLGYGQSLSQKSLQSGGNLMCHGMLVRKGLREMCIPTKYVVMSLGTYVKWGGDQIQTV